MALFDTHYPPTGVCFNWDPMLMYEHVVYNGLIALAYFVFPLIVFTKLRAHLIYLGRPLWTTFAAFVFCCGVDRTLTALSIKWWPAYEFIGLWHLVTASVSWVAIILLILNLGKIRENMDLFREIERKTQILDERLRKIKKYETRNFRN